MRGSLNDEVARLAMSWLVKTERFQGIQSSDKLSPAEIAKMAKESGDAERELKALLLFIMDNPGCKPCARCSDRAGTLVVKRASDFYESQAYWCMGCVREDRLGRYRSRVKHD